MTAIDPVCGMEVDELEAEAVLEYGGHTFLFCSEACREEFEENPDEFAEGVLDAVEPLLGADDER